MSQLISQGLCVQTGQQKTNQLTSQLIRGGSKIAAGSHGAPSDNKKRLEAFNFYHKGLQPRRLSSLICNSVNLVLQ